MQQHMDMIQQDDLQMLMEIRVEPCVSIYMPTERMGRETLQNPIRFKNMLAKAEDRLEDTGLSAAEQRELLEPVRQLEDDTVFWDFQGEGLAVFITPETHYTFRLPLTFDEVVVVSDRPHLKPLLPLLSHDAHFYVLALSQDERRLLHGTAHGMNTVQLPEDAPANLEESLRLDDPEAQLNVRTSATSYRGEGDHPSTFHGHPPDEEHKQNIRRYCRRIDNALTDLIADGQTPLVLAGVEYVRAIYHDVSRYPSLLDEGIDGNPEHMALEDLHRQAWALIEPMVAQDRQQALEQYQALHGKGDEQATNDLERVVRTAHYGQVDTLFVARGEYCWGTFDQQTGRVQFHDEPGPENRDLLDEAAFHTLKNGGTVYVMESDTLPDEATVAAVLRY